MDKSFNLMLELTIIMFIEMFYVYRNLLGSLNADPNNTKFLEKKIDYRPKSSPMDCKYWYILVYIISPAFQ